MTDNRDTMEELENFMERPDKPPIPIKEIIGFAIVIAAIIFLIFKVLLPSSNSIVGVWVGEGIQGQGRMEFTKDGELIMSDKGIEFMRCKYEVKGNELTMIIDGSSFAGLLGEYAGDIEETRSTTTFEIRNGNLFIAGQNGEETEFTKLK